MTSKSDRDYYKTLGLPRSASQDEIKREYRKLAMRYHPDKNPDNPRRSEEAFKKVAEAYGVLGDVDKRKRYDLYGNPDAPLFHSSPENASPSAQHSARRTGRNVDATSFDAGLFNHKFATLFVDSTSLFDDFLPLGPDFFFDELFAHAPFEVLHDHHHSMFSPTPSSLFFSSRHDRYSREPGFGEMPKKYFSSDSKRPKSQVPSRVRKMTTRITSTGETVTLIETVTRHADGTEERTVESASSSGSSTHRDESSGAERQANEKGWKSEKPMPSTSDEAFRYGFTTTPSFPSHRIPARAVAVKASVPGIQSGTSAPRTSATRYAFPLGTQHLPSPSGVSPFYHHESIHRQRELSHSYYPSYPHHFHHDTLKSHSEQPMPAETRHSWTPSSSPSLFVSTTPQRFSGKYFHSPVGTSLNDTETYNLSRHHRCRTSHYRPFYTSQHVPAVPPHHRHHDLHHLRSDR